MLSTHPNLFYKEGADDHISVWFKKRINKTLKELATTSKALIATQLSFNTEDSLKTVSQRSLRAGYNSQGVITSYSGELANNAFTSSMLQPTSMNNVRFCRHEYYPIYEKLAQTIKEHQEDIYDSEVPAKSSRLFYKEIFDNQNNWNYGAYKTMGDNYDQTVNGMIIKTFKNISLIFSSTSKHTIDHRWRQVNKIDIVIEREGEFEVIAVPITRMRNHKNIPRYIKKILPKIKVKELCLIHPDALFFMDTSVELKGII